MKKRLLSLVLALALCLGLTVPATAADTSGLDANGAKAYLNVLSDRINKYGMADSTGIVERGVYHAELIDMDGNRIPELIIVDAEGIGEALHVGVWTLRDGSAKQVFDASYDGQPGVREPLYIYLAEKGGQIGIVEDFRLIPELMEPGDINTYQVHKLDGSEETATESSGWKETGSMAFESEGCSWFNSALGYDDDPNLYTSAVQSALTAKAFPAPAAGTYGPYTITETQYSATFTMSFTSAKVEKTTVQLRSQWYIDGNLVQTDPYRDLNVTLVTLKTGSDVSLFESGGEFMDTQHSLIQDGIGKYTYRPAALSVGEDFNMGFLSSDGESLKQEIQSGPIMISTDDTTYIIAYESSTGFDDVINGAYYADAVQWAVDKEITAGTGANKFSPEQTCTVAQILTFLWRANGSPKQTGRNPFSDVASGDYYYDAALWAYGKGLVSGNKLNPNAACTRAMTVTYLWKLAGSPAASSASGFTDVPTTSDYAQAVTWAVEQNITSGTGNGQFSPNATCTRGQIVTFLYRAMG